MRAAKAPAKVANAPASDGGVVGPPPSHAGAPVRTKIAPAPAWPTRAILDSYCCIRPVFHAPGPVGWIEFQGAKMRTLLAPLARTASSWEIGSGPPMFAPADGVADAVAAWTTDSAQARRAARAMSGRRRRGASIPSVSSA